MDYAMSAVTGGAASTSSMGHGVTEDQFAPASGAGKVYLGCRGGRKNKARVWVNFWVL